MKDIISTLLAAAFVAILALMTWGGFVWFTVFIARKAWGD